MRGFLWGVYLWLAGVGLWFIWIAVVIVVCKAAWAAGNGPPVLLVMLVTVPLAGAVITFWLNGVNKARIEKDVRELWKEN